MIYITHRKAFLGDGLRINNVWRVKSSNVEEDYKEFMKNKSLELDIIINPHWLNIMNFENHHKHLSLDDYKIKKKEWNKILKFWNIDKYISEILKGRKENFESIYNFI